MLIFEERLTFCGVLSPRAVIVMSLKLKKIIDLIDSAAPFALAESWDHSGLRLGLPDAEIVGIAAALDATESNVREAARLGCDLLLTHHPLLFMPAGDLVCNRQDTRAAAAAFALGVNILSCHTNWDSAKGGVNAHLASLAKLDEVAPLIPAPDPRGFGMGAVGVASAASLEEFCANAAAAWDLSGYRLLPAGPFDGRVALCGGSGGDMWRDAAGVSTLYITADMAYHHCLEAREAGLNLMICDHGEMEDPAVTPLGELAGRLTGLPVHRLALARSQRWMAAGLRG